MTKKIMKRFIYALLCGAPFMGRTQDAYTLKFMPQLQQSQWVNAVNQPDAKVNVGIPVLSGMSFYYYNSGFSYNSLIHRVDDKTIAIHPGDFIDKLKAKNVVSFGTNINWLSFNIALPMQLNVGFSVSDRVDMRFSYPKDLLKFAWYGNGAYIGQTLDIGNFGMRASWYREYALHATKSVGKWTFGASPKLLFGKTNINTGNSSLKVQTAADYYAITANADLNVQTSGIADSTDKATGGMDFGSSYVFNKSNPGLGLDMAAKYRLDDKWDFTVGLNNLGYIRWKSNVHNYTAGPKSFTFDGFQLNGLFQGDTNFISTSQYLDSVKELIDFKENNNAYTTSLPWEFFAMANYHLNDLHTFGGQLSTQRFARKFVYAATVCYQLTLSKHFSGTLSYTLKTGAAFNVGGGLVARVAGIQAYFVTDNWWASVKPLNARNTNFHMGINVAVGDRVKKKSDGELKHVFNDPSLLHRDNFEDLLEEDENIPQLGGLPPVASGPSVPVVAPAPRTTSGRPVDPDE